ncbi:MAG: MBL fold metallo-hydrolase [Pseudomonadota bacterium]
MPDTLATSSLDFPWAERPAALEPIEVAPGLLWLCLPLPFALNHVNLWLLDDGDGWTLIDTGIDTDPLRQVWDNLLAGPLDGLTINRIVVTHFHPDHVGLAGWLCGRFKAPLFMPRTDWMKARWLSLDDSDRLAAGNTAFYAKAGVEPAALLEIANRGNMYARRVSPVPRNFNRLIDGNTIQMGGGDWSIITTPGHAPEMTCFYSAERQVFIAADHILPEISPNVGVWGDEQDANPLDEFKHSLEKVRQQVPDDCLVLPSHGRPFRGLHGRIDWLLAHHEERLNATLTACRDPATAKQVMLQLFDRQLDPHQWGFAMGEALAHLHALMAKGAVTRQMADDGAYRYKAN